MLLTAVSRCRLKYSDIVMETCQLGRCDVDSRPPLGIEQTKLGLFTRLQHVGCTFLLSVVLRSVILDYVVIPGCRHLLLLQFVLQPFAL